LDSEAAPEEVTAVQAVVDIVAKEHARLEELTQTLLEEDAEGNAIRNTSGVIGIQSIQPRR